MMSNDEYQLFLDNNNALVYAANNQIVDGIESDYALKIKPNGAESGTVWMFDANWYSSVDIVPDQVTPASDAIPQLSIVSGNAGVSTEYATGDHQHLLQVSNVLPAKDTAVGDEGVATTYARSDHTHHVNLGNSVPKKDTGTGTAGSANVYPSATIQHPFNIDPTTANVPLVNATAVANRTSDYYCRNDHVHPQQLTYDGNVTATKFTKTGGLATEVLCANGDTTIIDSKLSRTYNSSAGGLIRLCNFPASASVGSPFIEFKIYSAYNAFQTIRLVPYYTVNRINLYISYLFSICQIRICWQRYDRLRLSRSSDSNYSGIYLGCNPNSTSGSLTDQQSIVNTPTGELRIGVSDQLLEDNKGLMIQADGNTLTFNGSVIAGTAATNGATKGSVNFSAGNPILQGANCVGTEGGFYSNGNNVFWRAHRLKMGSVPP
ncbi:MAG: hypothetical protein EZS28_003745 [Streblomastix strix]|uniref:Uncharacterized protein n=1 Tax=Streblomastix strix TaxID=222440 RepID=A0A5J4X0M3_9EUKA|nr:MAG: hypothetical protein EZS28_003745 [Streblomastix strix]